MFDVGDDQIAVRSVTGVDMTLSLAGPGSRSYAFVIDWHIRLLLALAWLFVTVVILRFDAKLRSHDALVTSLPASLLYFLYHPVLEVAMRGRTPGKRMAGVRILNRHGGSPSTLALLIRNLFRLIDSLPFIYAVGLICCLITRHHVRIGDMAAGTLLVIDGSEAEKSLDRLESAARASSLPLETLELVDQLLERWDSLEAGHRASIGRALLKRIASAREDIEGLSDDQVRVRLTAVLQPAPSADVI